MQSTGGAAALVVDLGGGYVAMAQELLDFPDIDSGIQQQGSGGGAQGVGAVEPHSFLDRSRSLAT